MTELLRIWAQLQPTSLLQVVVIGGLAIGGYIALRKLMRGDAAEAASGAFGPLEKAVAEHEGRLAEHLDRLERLRADHAITAGRVRKLFTITDEMRERER